MQTTDRMFVDKDPLGSDALSIHRGKTGEQATIQDVSQTGEALTDVPPVLVAEGEDRTDPKLKGVVLAQKDLPQKKAALIEPVSTPSRKKEAASASPVVISKRDTDNVQALREQCRQIYLSLFFRDLLPVRSLGLTSAIKGEGKSFLATMIASALANDSSYPVTLLELNWEHPRFHEQLGITATPGLAEWLRGECHETDIRHKIDHNLTIIAAGNGRQDAVKLLQQIRRNGLLDMFHSSKELFIVDLPPVITVAYGVLAASIVESLLLVVRAGTTPDLVVAKAYEHLKDLPLDNMVLNQVESRIPRWIRQLL